MWSVETEGIRTEISQLCCHRGYQPTLKVQPRASSTVISSSLWACGTSSFLPALPQILASTLSLIPLIWPLHSWSPCVSSRSWANGQVCQERQEGNLGLSQCAGYRRVALKKCVWERSKSSQAGDKWRLGWWVPQDQLSCGYGGKMRTLKIVVEAPCRHKEVPEIEKCGRKVIFLVCIWGLWISFLCKEGLPGILWPVLYPEGNSLALDPMHTWDFTLQWGCPVTNHLQNVINKVFLRCKLCDCFHAGLLLAHSSAGLSKLHNI